MNAPPQIPPPWLNLLPPKISSEVDATWRRVIGASRGPIYPPGEEVFAALRLCPPEAVRAVIVGQDPYHSPGQAHGLAFSVRRGVRPPPSLQNIFRELADDLALAPPGHGCLESWARSGVLLLNTVLTVEQGRPGSHQGLGWEQITDLILETVAATPRHVAFLLWGKHAESKKALIPSSQHLVVASPHPSPFSAARGFYGSRPFSRVNRFLLRHNAPIIDWKLT